MTNCSKHIGLAFSSNMMDAIQANRKFQTRRLKFTGKTGDFIWVKESYYVCRKCENYQLFQFEKSLCDKCKAPLDSKKSSRFMPKRLTRLWLEITSVREERLLDISDKDALEEGFDESFEHSEECDNPDCQLSGGIDDCPGIAISPRDNFLDIFYGLNGIRTKGNDPKKWPNPTVKVVCFRIARPDDET